MNNTSGQGKGAVVPDEIKRWNWGAFLLSWIWGIGNKSYIALLCFIPIVGLVMPFVLGYKGSTWAWQNSTWESVEHFKRVQRKWMLWGVALLILSIVSIAAILNLVINENQAGMQSNEERTEPGKIEANYPKSDTVPASDNVLLSDPISQDSVTESIPATTSTPIADRVSTPDTAPAPGLTEPASISAPIQAKPTDQTAGIAQAIPPLSSSLNDSAKTPATHPKTRASSDLRHCLDLPTNEAIAKCASE